MHKLKIISCLLVLLSGSIQAASLEFVFEPPLAKEQQSLVLIKRDHILESLKLFSDQNFKLRSSIRFIFHSGNGPFFDSRNNEIIIPYSFIAETYESLSAKYPNQDQVRDRVFIGAIEQLLWHEFSQALISQFELPVEGLLEYAVDDFSTLLLLNFHPLGDGYILDALEEYLLIDKAQVILSDSQFESEHEFDVERYRKIVCMVLGRDFEVYPKLLQELVWDAHGLKRCQLEYLKKMEKWVGLMWPILQPDSAIKKWLQFNESREDFIRPRRSTSDSLN